VSQEELPPPGLEVCLVRLRASSQKGGTIIAEDVTDLGTHERRLSDPDGYRPRSCPRCGGSTLHVHDYRWRVLRGDPGKPETSIVRYVCVGCEAIWQTLPVFIARHLWRTWQVVEYELTGAEPTRVQGEKRRWPPVPERTRRRWRARWLRPVRFVAQVLASCGEATWVKLASALASAATCADLVAFYASRVMATSGHVLEAVAALIYRLQPKVRLM
jgi:hypothetical protein